MPIPLNPPSAVPRPGPVRVSRTRSGRMGMSEEWPERFLRGGGLVGGCTVRFDDARRAEEAAGVVDREAGEHQDLITARLDERAHAAADRGRCGGEAVVIDLVDGAHQRGSRVEGTGHAGAEVAGVLVERQQSLDSGKVGQRLVERVRQEVGERLHPGQRLDLVCA